MKDAESRAEESIFYFLTFLVQDLADQLGYYIVLVR